MPRGIGRDKLLEDGDDLRTAEQSSPHYRCRLEHPADLPGISITDHHVDAVQLSHRGKHSLGLDAAGIGHFQPNEL